MYYMLNGDEMRSSAYFFIWTLTPMSLLHTLALTSQTHSASFFLWYFEASHLNWHQMGCAHHTHIFWMPASDRMGVKFPCPITEDLVRKPLYTSCGFKSGGENSQPTFKVPPYPSIRSPKTSGNFWWKRSKGSSWDCWVAPGRAPLASIGRSFAGWHPGDRQCGGPTSTPGLGLRHQPLHQPPRLWALWAENHKPSPVPLALFCQTPSLKWFELNPAVA